MPAFAAKRALLPVGPRSEIVNDVTIAVDDAARIVEVRPWAAGDPPPLDGIVLPGLVNAHLHLELSHLAGAVPGGYGLPLWVRALMTRRAEGEGDPAAAMLAAARAMRDAGVVAVCDVANGDATAPLLAALGFQGVVQREVLGLDARAVPARVQQALEPDQEILGEHGGIVLRASPHAVYSTAPTVIRAAVRGREPLGVERSVTETDRATRRRERPPATIHCAEDREEERFLRGGDGAWAKFLDRMGLDWRWFQAPGCSPVEYLDALGVLGPDLLVVHGVHLSNKDRSLLANRGSALALCPRSNLHIGGDLPDLPALLADGVKLAVGTDSLASCADLDPLGDVAVLTERFPDVDPQDLLHAATAGGADALRLGHLGRIAVGRSPGLVLCEGAADARDLAGAPRRVLVSAGAPS